MGQPYQAVILDLDNCICDAREPGADLFAPAFDAICSANNGHVPDDRLQAAFGECWFTSFDLVARRYGFTKEMYEAGFAVFSRLEGQKPLHGYADLPVLPGLSIDKYLVTTGFRRLQDSKVRALGIAPWFRKVVIDAVDVPPHRGKQAIFADLLAEGGYEPDRVLAVGDNPLSELAAGKALGMVTVQTLRPRVQEAQADFHIRSFDALAELIRRGTPD
jgi:putative hydrolase of the HAD superfamily